MQNNRSIFLVMFGWCRGGFVPGGVLLTECESSSLQVIYVKDFKFTVLNKFSPNEISTKRRRIRNNTKDIRFDGLRKALGIQ